MKLTIHDVGHGSCISLLHNNGKVILWDCGHQADNRPSNFLPLMGANEIHRFIVTNYDEDHISDLPKLRHDIGAMVRNPTINAESLRQLKLRGGPISPAMESLLCIMRTHTHPISHPCQFPGVEMKYFYNSFDDFEDTNNCSVVTFLNCNGTHFIFPGDLEQKGWMKLLENTQFCEHLRQVHYFIASHHGRESGYCADVFKLCKPHAVIFSDSNIKFATQETADKYRQHCTGTSFKRESRYVLSTRKDGDIPWVFSRA